MAVKNSILGVTDLPCGASDKDSLDTKKYVQGLADFILHCPTPMSIALQGDWGTGKTSIINRLSRELDNKKIKYVYFNTWQYSQFNMKDNLYLAFVHSLIKKLDPNNDFAKKVFSALSCLTTSLVKATTKVELDKVGSVIDAQNDAIQLISEMKDDFSDLIKKQLKIEKDCPSTDSRRLVIFIDDLDRLNPEIAVELLEAIKLFMDVKHCVFVLAVDYDVVVSGVRKKFGRDFSDEKCRSFFDKIIQLPFRMPVEDYHLDGLLNETLGEYLNKTHIMPLTDMITATLGANPRAFKRLANSFFLIYSIRKHPSSQSDNVLILCSLCLQLANPKVYIALRKAESDDDLQKIVKNGAELIDPTPEEKQEYLRDNGFDGDLSDAEWTALPNILAQLENFLDEVLKDSVSDKYSQLMHALDNTSITSVESSSIGRSKVYRVTVNGRDVPTTSHSAVNAFLNTCSAILTQQYTQDPEKVNAYIAEYTTLISWERTSTVGYFRAYKTFELGGRQIYLGVNSGTEVQKQQIRVLCRYFKLDPGYVKWYGNEKDEIFSS